MSGMVSSVSSASAQQTISTSGIPHFQVRSLVFTSSSLTPEQVFKNPIKPHSPLYHVWRDSACRELWPIPLEYVDVKNLTCKWDMLVFYFAARKTLTIWLSYYKHHGSWQPLDVSKTFWDSLQAAQDELQACTKSFSPSDPAKSRGPAAPVKFMGYTGYELLSKSVPHYNLPCRASAAVPNAQLGFWPPGPPPHSNSTASSLHPPDNLPIPINSSHSLLASSTGRSTATEKPAILTTLIGSKPLLPAAQVELEGDQARDRQPQTGVTQAAEINYRTHQPVLQPQKNQCANATITPPGFLHPDWSLFIARFRPPPSNRPPLGASTPTHYLNLKSLDFLPRSTVNVVVIVIQTNHPTHNPLFNKLGAGDGN
ncbi:hypothetical protein PtB15_7B236 [Puccinia triticina]|nr:hypothetical protein PtB15_7B236 [Puccinia triticina]